MYEFLLGILYFSVSHCMVGGSDVAVTNVCASPDIAIHHGSMVLSRALKLKVRRRRSITMVLTAYQLNVSTQ